MKRSRRKFTSAFKAQVAMEAIKERETLSQLAKRFGIHPNQISKWKREFLENVSKIFDGETGTPSNEEQMDKLFRKIGELEVENDFLKKNLWKTGL